MRKLFLALCVIILSSQAFSSNLTEEIRADFDKIIQKSGLPKGELGLSVVDPDNKVIYALNSEKRQVPASITKLFTAAAILSHFMPDHQFRTQIFADGDQEGSILKGNIYLKGGGDPAFVSEKMWLLVNDFSRSGIKKITGKIIADDSIFDEAGIDEGREVSSSDRAYNAQTSGLSFNWNSTTIYVRPGTDSGEPAKIWVDPENEIVSIKNKVKTSKSGTDLQATREAGVDKDVIVVSGKIAEDSPEKHIYKNVTNPALYAAANLRSFLKQRGIEVDGAIARGVTPTHARLTGSVDSDSLGEIIQGMDKFSNNFVAEMLVKGLGASKTGHQGKMSEGLEQVRVFMRESLGLASDKYVLDNVSGFTRKNSFSPSQFTNLLQWILRQYKFAPEFMQSLPVAGVDGTLKDRMKHTVAERRVRAKTGSLDGVVSLAGFAGRQDNGLLIFTFVYNGRGDESHVRHVFDDLAKALVK